VIVSPAAASYRDVLVSATHEIETILVSGMRFEDKGTTLSVHYRQTSDPEYVANELALSMQNIAQNHGLHLTKGRLVFEFRPPVEIDKGTAFEDLIKTHRLDAAFYLGDDTTDVAAFYVARRLHESGRCLAFGFGVESQGMPQAVLSGADYHIQEVAGVESFLSWLLKARMASSTWS
jgi:trehalose-phosphatase